MQTKVSKAVKGMPDLLPSKLGLRQANDKLEHVDKLPVTAVWQWLRQQLATWLQTYGYAEIGLPIVEPTELYEHAIGSVSDIVSKEMFSWQQGEHRLTLRPEGTAGCVRACLQHNLLRHGRQQRLWYYGPMFRAEETQLGRYRQFHQLGVEAFNFSGIEIEAEQISMLADLWQRLGLKSHIELEINTLGTQTCRQLYRQALVAYFERYKDQLDDLSLSRLATNPLRILDSKQPELQSLCAEAPQAIAYLIPEARVRWERFLQLLTDLGLPYRHNPRLVRGLDYYEGLVFEWVTPKLGAQATVCAGGRYDKLLAYLGGEASYSACGFAMGIERLLLLLLEVLGESMLAAKAEIKTAHFVTVGELDLAAAMASLSKLRALLPELSIWASFKQTSLKNQVQQASKSGAKWLFLVGEAELANSQVTVKRLTDGVQLQLDLNADLPAKFWQEL